MNRYKHYESAFEDFLKSRGVPYIAVDETKKASFAGAHIKSFDFLVYTGRGPNLLADVKGRKFPYRNKGGPRRWESWVGMDDVEGLERWEQVFGEGFRGMLVFAYLLAEEAEAARFQLVHRFEDRLYAFLGLPVSVYRSHLRLRSPRWHTVSMPVSVFRTHARPISDFL